MAPCTEEQRTFVHRHVGVFSDRHRVKLDQVFPVKTTKAIIQESNNRSLILAATRINNLEEGLVDLRNKLNEAIDEFNGTFGATLNQLVHDSMTTRAVELQKKQDEFDYKLRMAIGLVDLVSPDRAYDVLESCRRQIENLGKE